MNPVHGSGGYPPHQPPYASYPPAPSANSSDFQAMPEAYPPVGSQFPPGPYPSADLQFPSEPYPPGPVSHVPYVPGPVPQGPYGPGPGLHDPYNSGSFPQGPHGQGYASQGQYGPTHAQGPAGANWMARPVVSGCPPGLEYLTQINQLLVKQKKEILELMTNIETSNKYVIVNTMGQRVYNCEEESNFCARQCCKAQRPYTMHVQDNSGMEVIRVKRPYKCSCCCECCSCFECCQDELTIEAPVGQVAGYVKQLQEGCNIRYAIKDASGKTVLRIHGPSYCHCACLGEDIKFKVMSADRSTEVGRITKQWSNILQEMFTDADNFGVTFPIDLDVRIKATLIGAVFLIDFMFFEENQPRRDD